jgi:hypothetical protein
MSIAVSDTNIFIDLLKTKLIDFLFEIEIPIHTTQEAFEQLSLRQQSQIIKFITGPHCISSFSDSEIAEISDAHFPQGLNYTDRTLFYYAQKNNAILILGDSKFHSFCLSKSLKAEDFFWLLETFMEKKLIDKRIAIMGLNKLMTINPRLPKQKCQTKLIEWNNL